VLELVKVTESEEATKSSYERDASARFMRADYWATRAATRKRLAEIQYLQCLKNKSREELKVEIRSEEWMETLRNVFADYEQGLQQGIQVDHWILVQYFVLRLVAGPRNKSFTKREEIWWKQALQSIEFDLLSDNSDDQMWARASRVDLLMVALADPTKNKKNDFVDVIGDADNSHKIANSMTQMLIQMVEESGYDHRCPAIWPTWRQFWRWNTWWTHVHNSGSKAAAESGYNYLWKLVQERFPKSDSA
jgi:hypothetical protein